MEQVDACARTHPQLSNNLQSLNKIHPFYNGVKPPNPCLPLHISLIPQFPICSKVIIPLHAEGLFSTRLSLGLDVVRYIVGDKGRDVDWAASVHSLKTYLLSFV